jgi:hypothetical protein
MGFTKEVLKTGYIVQRRNGSYAMVIKGSFDGDKMVDMGNYFNYMKFEYYLDNMIESGENHEFDIMKVFKATNLTYVFRHVMNKDYEKLELLWQRESEQKVNLRKSLEALEKQSNDIQEQIRITKEQIEKMN